MALRRHVCAQVALQHGCGDKWGLFASHIPHRVGYQCSAAYRHIIIPKARAARAAPCCSCAGCVLTLTHARQPQGLLRDNNFRMTASGEAIWASGRALPADSK